MLAGIVFICGAALMSLEIVAARVLAPALGNSIFVWGSVISSVMIALTLGYWLGGQVADRFGASRTLAPLIACAGLFTVGAPLAAAQVLPWTADLGPRAGSLLAATLIFFVPSLLLAMVTPLGVRLVAARGMGRIGRSAGTLSSISTAGSIVGTLVTSFWLIPALSLDPLIVSTGFVLLATAAVALFLPITRHAEPAMTHERPLHAAVDRGIQRFGAIAGLALIASGVVLGGWVLVKVAPAPSVNALGEAVLFRQDTQYHRITVTESATSRNLRFDASRQSGMSLSDPVLSTARYADYLQLAGAISPDATSALVLGLGGGAVPKRLLHDYPAIHVDSVEIDPVVVDVAQRYFALPDDPRSRVLVEDARHWVQTAPDRYGMVFVDTYYADALPYHMTTQEFFQETKRRMTPGGVLAYNVIGAVEGDDSKLFRSLYKTAGTVWEHLWVFRVDAGANALPTSRQNIIVLATDADVSGPELVRRIRSSLDGRSAVPGLADMARDLYSKVVPLGDVPLLTDSYAPTDSLLRVQ